MKKGITIIILGIVILTLCEIIVFHRINNKKISDMEKKITFIVPIANSGYWGNIAGGIIDTVDDYQYSVKCVGFSGLDVEKQIYEIENAILSGADGIITAPNEVSPEFEEVIRKAQNADIPIIFVDSDDESLGRNCYVGSDNFSAGKTAGEQLVQACREEGKIAIITSFMSNTNQKERIQGFQKVVDQFPSMEIVEIIEGESNTVILNEKIYNLLENQPDICAFFCTEGYASKSMCRIVEKEQEKYKDLKIITFDSSDNTKNAVNNGWIQATLLQNPYEMGCRAAQAMFQILSEGTECIENQYIETTLVDQSNSSEEGIGVIRREDILWHTY